MYPNYDFWSENKPSGNPDLGHSEMQTFDGENIRPLIELKRLRKQTSSNPYFRIVTNTRSPGVPDRPYL
jgi:hypothetical protein